MSARSIAVHGNTGYKSGRAAVNMNVFVWGLVLVLAAVLIAVVAGNADIAVNPYVPTRVL